MNTLVDAISTRVRSILWFAAVVAVLLGTGATAVYWSADGYASLLGFQSDLHLIGTLAMMSVQPAYLLSCLLFMYRQTLTTLEALRPIAPAALVDETLAAAKAIPPVCALTIPLGVVFGLYQNAHIFDAVDWATQITARDYGILLGNTIIWSSVALVLTWVVPTMLRLSRLGAALTVDLYQLHKTRPLPMLATKFVLIVAGALAFMPLQSLDAEFRWVNYQAGLTIGLPAAALLFVVPIWGLRAAIKQQRSERLSELEREMAGMNRSDTVRLEAVAAHIARIQAMPNWPVDVALVLRILGYVIIAPLAWVGAALVEGLIDDMSF